MTPSEYADYVGLSYAASTSSKHKKDNGQFFTSKTTSDFMAHLAKPQTKKISILDPGCGTAILSCSLIEKLVSSSEITEISLRLYETDKHLAIQTQLVVDYLAQWLADQDIKFHCQISEEDFVLDHSSVFESNALFASAQRGEYDYIISNPPYFKISKADKRSLVAKDLVYGQPNIYALFMGLAAKLLKKDGELIFITPRSFAAGNYFKAFRQSFFNDVSISDIHIFGSRNSLFKQDQVLQENIILRATKAINSTIRISVSSGENSLHAPASYNYLADELLDLNSKERVLFIPSNPSEAEAINIFKSWDNTLTDFGIQISTGPVVAFRCADYLKKDEQNNVVPLVWLHNVKEMEFAYPLQKGNKARFIEMSKSSQKVLLKNKNYIFLRRFSSKDDKSRLVCCPYFSRNIDVEMIGVENHINYIYRPNGDLSEAEVWGLSALFSSKLFDTYFRSFNGNTQVGASELKQIKMPPLRDVEIIGNKVNSLPHCNQQEIDNVIKEVLLEKTNVKNIRSTRDFKGIGVA